MDRVADRVFIPNHLAQRAEVSRYLVLGRALSCRLPCTGHRSEYGPPPYQAEVETKAG